MQLLQKEAVKEKRWFGITTMFPPNITPAKAPRISSGSGEGSFVEFVTTTRIDAAKELMATTDMKIYEISDKLGFETASYFSKVFKRQEGVSPREYMQMLEK